MGKMECSRSVKLMKEIAKLHRHPPEDVTILVEDDSLSSLSALMVGPEGTPYEKGQFKLTLHFSASYPQAPPKGFFVTKIWHPNVDWSTGAICVNTLKRDWKPNFGVRHVLIAIRSLLIVPNYDSALNEEAGKQIMSAFDDY